MKGTQKRKSGRSGFELIEQATHLLRAAPVSTLLMYYLGTIPFVLGFLFFWADMSLSAFAEQHLTEAALGMALLFLWMKHWQAVFARHVRAIVSSNEPPAFSLRQHLKILLGQTILQPSGLLLIPLSLIPAGLPLPWVIAYYQNVTALADPDSADISKQFKAASKQASLWPMQNHILLSLLAIFTGCVFLNCCIAAATIPSLIKMLFGIETVFTQSPYALLNTTFFMAMLGVCYLCVDPILKVVFVLRCFYGESLQSGEDLKAELKRFGTTTQKLAAGVLVLFSVCIHAPAQESQVAPSPSPSIERSPGIPPVELDQRISEVISERKYAWRVPKEEVVRESEPGVIAKFFQKIADMIRDAVRSTLEWLNDLARRLFQRKLSSKGPNDAGSGWMTTQQTLIFLLIVVIVVALVLFLLRNWRRKRIATTAVALSPAQPAPDLSDENVAADQLPEDGWTQLGRELLERGEYRLAMRAFYLASLAHLAQRNLISIARFKSNRDYANELQRRAHALPNLLPVFGENISAFERIWYGMHEVNREKVTEFAANVERLKTA
jgi:Cytochrome c biogenesis factor